MRHLILILVMLASLAHADPMAAYWASVNASGGGAYIPPGYAQSLIWWKFDTSANSNITDYSTIGTNVCDIAGTGRAKTSWNSSYGWALTNTGDVAFFKQRYASRTGDQVTNYTIALWVKPTSVVLYDGWFLERGNKCCGLSPSDDINNVTMIVADYYQRQFPLSLSNWCQYVFVSRNATNYFYTNGVLCYAQYPFNGVTALIVSNGIYGDGTWHLGTDPYNLTRTFNGYIYDVYFTGYGMTSNDVMDYYTNGRRPL